MPSSRRSLRLAGVTTLGIAGATLVLATINKIVEQSVPPPEVPLGQETTTFAWTEGDISYTVAGHGPALILLHGIYAGASSFEFRRIFAELTKQFRVFAPDLPGFGRSARSSRIYHPDLYVDFIHDFTRQVAGGADHPVALLATSLTCAFAIEAAADRPDLFDRLLLVEPVGIQELAQQPNIAQQLFGSLLRAPVVGDTLYNLLVSRSGLRRFLSHQVYLQRGAVTDDLVDTYYATSHQPNARYATASFIEGSLNLDIGDVFEILHQPILLCWGRKAKISPLEHADAFLDRNPNAELAIFDRSGALPHEEEPTDFVVQISTWLRASISSHH